MNSFKNIANKVFENGTMEELKDLKYYARNKEEEDYLKDLINRAEKGLKQIELMELRECEERMHPMYRKYNNYWVQI